MPNPYYCCNRIPSPDLFVGRELELRRIFAALETVHTGQLQSVSVVGPRRIGRSSLLLHLTQTYDNRLRSPQRYVFAYFDLLSGQFATQHGLLSGILSGLHQNLPDTSRDLKRRLQAARRDSALELDEFEQSIDLFHTVPPEPLFPVVCLDEFEQLSRYPDRFPKWMFDSWRSLINAGRAAFVISSVIPLYELAEQEKLTSQFFNIFSDYIPLGDLSEAEAYRLAVRGKKCDRPFVDEDVRRVLEWGGKHPLKLQQAGTAIYEAKSDANPDWKAVRQTYEKRVQQNFGVHSRGSRAWRWLLDQAELVGRTAHFWRGNEGADPQVYRLLGALIMLIMVLAVVAFAFSPLFRTWVGVKVGVPTPSPVVTEVPTP